MIVPFIPNPDVRDSVIGYCEKLAEEIRHARYHGHPIKVIVDKRDLRGGEKTWGWIKKGVPLRIEVGPREMESEIYQLARRDKGHKDTTQIGRTDLSLKLPVILDEIQHNLLVKATHFRDKHTVRIDHKKEFYDFFTPKGDEIHGGFALCHWNGDPAIEAKVKEDLNVTIRCIPHGMGEEAGRCIFTGEPSQRRVLFAKAY